MYFTTCRRLLHIHEVYYINDALRACHCLVMCIHKLKFFRERYYTKYGKHTQIVVRFLKWKEFPRMLMICGFVENRESPGTT